MNKSKENEIAAYERKIFQALKNEKGARKTGRKWRNWYNVLPVLTASRPINCSQEIEKYADRILKLRAAG